MLDLRQATVIALNLSRSQTSISQCSQRQAGRRKRARCASPLLFLLPMVPCASSPLTRVSCLYLFTINEAPEEVAGSERQRVLRRIACFDFGNCHYHKYLPISSCHPSKAKRRYQRIKLYLRGTFLLFCKIKSQ